VESSSWVWRKNQATLLCGGSAVDFASTFPGKKRLQVDLYWMGIMNVFGLGRWFDFQPRRLDFGKEQYSILSYR